MKISGLDLANLLNGGNLSAADYDVIYNALIKNVELGLGYDDVDRSLPSQLLHNLRRYIKINLLDSSSFFSPDKASGKPDLHMALCIYMLPEQSKDPKIQEYLEIIKSLGLESNQAINFLRSQPFKFDHIVKIAKVVQLEQERFKVAGFWEGNVNDLLSIISAQLLSVTYENLYEINRQFDYTPIAIATKVIFFIEILHYINKRRNDQGFMMLMDLYQFDHRSLRGFTKQVLALLKDALLELEAMPDQSHESVVSSCGILLFRATCLLKQAMSTSTSKDSKVAKKVVPGR